MQVFFSEKVYLKYQHYDLHFFINSHFKNLKDNYNVIILKMRALYGVFEVHPIFFKLFKYESSEIYASTHFIKNRSFWKKNYSFS